MPKKSPPSEPRNHDWSHFLIQNTPGAVITADQEGRITEFNRAAERLTGFSRGEAMGRPAEEVVHLRGADLSTWNLVCQGQKEVTEELSLRNRSGQEVPVMISSFALRDDRGVSQGGAIIIRDLTPVKRMETERRHLVNMFAHDLKTPVVATAGLISRLIQGKLGPVAAPQMAYLQIVGQELERLEKLITRFLEFARLDLRIMTPQPEITGKQKEAAEAGLSAALESQREAENAVRSKTLLEVSLNEARTAVLQNRQSLITADIQIADFNSELNNILGLPLDTVLELSDPGPSDGAVQTREHYLQAAISGNAELEAAKANADKARGGVKAAYDEYIPDVSFLATHNYQDGLPFLTNNVGTFGIMMTWNIWDWGKRGSVVGERKAQLSQAQENLHRINDQVTVEMEKAYRKLERTKSIMAVAREALALQRERLRLISDQLKASTISPAKHAEVVAAVKKAESDELQARLGYEFALAELNRITGTFKR